MKVKIFLWSNFFRELKDYIKAIESLASKKGIALTKIPLKTYKKKMKSGYTKKTHRFILVLTNPRKEFFFSLRKIWYNKRHIGVYVECLKK